MQMKRLLVGPLALTLTLTAMGCGSKSGSDEGSGGAGGGSGEPTIELEGKEVHLSADADAKDADGTEKHPFASFADAVAAMEDNEDWTGTLIVHEGTYSIKEDVILPVGVKMEVEAGTTMKFAELKAFHAQADVKLLGTAEKPILLTSATKGKYWGSFTNYEPSSQDNVFQYVIFEKGVNSNFNDILERGVLALNQAKALITHCIFRDNTGDDALTLVNSDSTVEYSQFLNNISDAIDQGFGPAEIRYSYSEGNGNDSWDIGDGSTAWIHHNVSYGAGDKCISVGEGSGDALVEHNLCIDGEIGVAIKDESTPTIRYNTIYGNGVGVWVYPSASGYGTGKGTFEGNIVWNSSQADFDLSADYGTVFAYNCGSTFNTPLGDTVEGAGMIGPDSGCDDPLFVDPDNEDPDLRDYHLKSETGHYSLKGLNLTERISEEGKWVKDDETSPCIDMGNPKADAELIDAEPSPNGSRVNLGAYAGTEQASKSP